MKSNKIIFTNLGLVSEEYYPQPASKFLPEWYKKTDSYVTGKKEIYSPNINLDTTASIKKCIPVFDALTAGYIIPTYCDIWVSKDAVGNILYSASLDQAKPFPSITFHDIIQAPYHPRMNNYPYPKINSPWSIKTPKGYSCLFIPPVHGGNKFFTIAEGFVDTDKYSSPVNFPFVLNDTSFEGLIPAGTPIVQVIPIKRDKWKINMGTEKDKKNAEEINNRLMSKFFDRYKTMFWEGKEYK